jgi:predicted Zn-dependent protease
MNNDSRLISACLLFFCLAVLGPCASAQTSSLPRATFPTFARDNGTQLPSGGGLHLTDGQDRPANAPPEVYNPGEPTLNHELVRWDASRMPIKVWISPGLKLPYCPFNDIQATRVDQVDAMLHQPKPFSDLARVSSWTEDVNFAVADGIEEWRQFQNEGLFSFGFVDSPAEANVLVFFNDGFHEEGGPGGISVAGITSAQVFPYAAAMQGRVVSKPVVIELSTTINSSLERMQAAAAHEFGHALGIKEHSPFRDDIMYVDRIVTQLSPSDKATIRWLYHQKPQYVMW